MYSGVLGSLVILRQSVEVVVEVTFCAVSFALRVGKLELKSDFSVAFSRWPVLSVLCKVFVMMSWDTEHSAVLVLILRSAQYSTLHLFFSVLPPPYSSFPRNELYKGFVLECLLHIL